MSCGGRGVFSPDLVDQAVVRHHLAGTEQQGGENGLLLATAEIERALIDLGFECTEDAKPERLWIARLVNS